MFVVHKKNCPAGAQWKSPHGRTLPAVGQRTLILGIVNVTPDSFSDGGSHNTPDAAVAHARQLVAAGADILDVGAESTRPGHSPLSAGDELERLLQPLRAIRAALPQTPLSVDTYKPAVAADAIAAGADIINDIWGCAVSDSAGTTGTVAAATGAPLILMHNRTAPITADVNTAAGTAVFWNDFCADVQATLNRARAADVPASQIWLDPGFGFGKTPAQNLLILRELDRLAAFGFPVLLGTSRKSTLGLVLDGAGVHQRLEADKAAAVWGVSRGAAMLRLHEVTPFRDLLKMTNAILNSAIRNS
jgi:dihydropteroate synthase